MRTLRAALSGTLTRTALAIAVSTTVIIYFWAVTIEGNSGVKH